MDRAHIFSRPVEVHSAGWRSDTQTLQRYGWELQADQDIYQASMRLAGKHPSGSAFITQYVRWEYTREFHRGGFLPPLQAVFGGTVNVHDTGTDMRALERGQRLRQAVNPRFEPTWNGFRPIDAEMQIREVLPSSLESLLHFAPAVPRLIVPQDTVGDLLERIEKLQQPVRHEVALRSVIGVY
jgi:hypothetical protein